MTPSPDLLAVLREALPELRAVASTIQDCAEISAHSSWADRIDTALARIDSALSAHEAQGWRPIESAPKDGTPLRLFAESLIDEDFNPSGSAEGHWCDDVGWQAALWNDSAEEFYTAVIYPTHWQPLPPPPETTT